MQNIKTILSFYKEAAALKNKTGDEVLDEKDLDFVALKKNYLNQKISLVIRIRKVDSSGISGRIMPEDKTQIDELFTVEESTGHLISQTLSVTIWQEDFVNKMIAAGLRKDDLLKVEGTIGDIDEFFLLIENISNHETIENTDGVDVGFLMFKQRLAHPISSNQKAETEEVLTDEQKEQQRTQQLKMQYEKLLQKSKVWSNWGTAFLILAGVAVIMVLSKDISQVISIAFWGGLGVWFKKKSKEFKKQADELSDTHFANTAQGTNNSLNEHQQKIDECYNEQDAVGEVPHNMRASIEKNSELLEGVYITNNANLVQSLQFVGDVSASSGWSGLAEDIGIKNAQKSLVKKVKTLNGNVVLITKSSTDWGIKIKGKAYVC